MGPTVRSNEGLVDIVVRVALVGRRAENSNVFNLAQICSANKFTGSEMATMLLFTPGPIAGDVSTAQSLQMPSSANSPKGSVEEAVPLVMQLIELFMGLDKLFFSGFKQSAFSAALRYEFKPKLLSSSLRFFSEKSHLPNATRKSTGSRFPVLLGVRSSTSMQLSSDIGELLGA